MQVNSLLERMRKVRQEKAAAAAAAAATATAAAPLAVTNATATVPAANAASRDAPVSSAADADTAGGGGVVSSSFLTGVTVPAPPPVFASPSSARLEYRDNARDPLCVPFTCDMVVPVLNALLSDHQRGSTSTVAAATSGGLNGAVVPMMMEAVDSIDATGGDARDVSTLSSASAAIPGAGRDSSGKENQPIVVAKAVVRMREVLAALGPPQMPQKTTVESVPSITTTGTATAASASVSSLRPSSASLFADAAYNTACAVARVDVSGAIRPICRDVNYYTRVGRISQGVYGVVFRAVTTADYERQHRQQSRHRVARPGSAASSAAVPSARVRTYALKHIKKMWLEDSQVGLPPYLMREIDLLLRLQHPNIMGALELVLLDPTPVPRRLASPPESCSPSSSSESSSSSSSSESPSTEQHAEEATECDRALRRLRSTTEDTAGQNLAKKAKIDNAEEPPPQREEARPATQAQPTGEKGTAQDAAATRPLAAVGAASKAKDVFLVMDYCPYDLGSYMRRYATAAELHGDGGDCKSTRASAQVPYFHITPRNAHPQAAASYVARAKSIVYQILRAVAFLHDSRILHRDLKTSNVLLREDGYVKVCDFGLGRLYREGQALTPTVVTLMYRAPELHFGVVDYSHKMDVWSVGCIFAELFLRRPLFHASTDSHHLLAVCEVLGIPTEESFPGLYHLPQTKTMMQSLPRWNRTSRLASLFQRGAVLPTVAHGDVPVAAEGALLPESGVDLLASVLQWNPRRRPSAAEALQHPFFKEEPLPCAPAELMRPMPWMDAAAAAGNAMPSSVLVREDRRGQPGSRGSQDGLSTATQMAPSTTGRPSSESVPPAMQHVADIPSGVEATVAAVSSASEGATAASPLARASPDTFPGGSRSVVVSDTVGGRYQQAIATRDYSGSDGDFAEEDEEKQRLQLHTRRSTRDQAEDDDDSDAETERVGRQARLLANQDRDE
ncbi:protein kinase-like protein [Leishmania major strain Friedlin]|uniref:Protein kinase-like protein n=1 Tax=Leishmania major TaxID=5664 RepID=E9ADH4_LEIMA|nr:protein kinase-like protein [Leishmania major strain Friedlin]CAG9576804.1 protein_kinase-like_protein [Leishmania major strain Friedlin]CBZ12264.1 protein kinase-like protein [Leishmania major strain Friedlin]|eukprot:XP_003722003.1 protein kinase-like protein [Leishmania major strain Friedlin]